MDRNAIIDALTERLRSNLPGVRVERRMRQPAPEEMPLLVVGGTTEQSNDGDDSLPGRWTINLGCFLWAHEPRDQGPNPTLMALIDQVEAGLKAQPGECHSAWTNLGGLVWQAVFTGVDSLPDADSLDVGLALLRISIQCKPTR